MTQKMVRSERRIQILQALHECLKEKPFHQTSIKDIANKAGVNHGLLHYYFENKEDILLQYIDYIFDKYLAIYTERFNLEITNATVTNETFSEVCRWLLNEVSFNPELARIFTEIWSLAIYNRKVMRKLKDHYRQWKNGMSALVENFVSDKKTADRLSLTLIALAEGMSLFSIFFRRSDLCTDLDYQVMMQSMVPANGIKIS